MSDSKIIEVLRAFGSYLHLMSYVGDALRLVGYWVLYGITLVVNGIAGVFKSVFNLLNFWDYGPLQDFITKWEPVGYALASVAIVWAGVMIMMHQKGDAKGKLNNALVAVLLFVGGSYMINQMTTLVNAGISSSVGKTAAVSIWQGNITDLYALDDAGWKVSDGKAVLPSASKRNHIDSMEDLKLLNISEVVDTGGWFGGSEVGKDGKDILVHTVSKNQKGKYELHNMKGIFKFDQYYYRYSWHPWYLAADLLLLALTYIFVLFKAIHLELEIVFTGGLMHIIALTDLDSGSRNKKMFFKIRDGFIVLFLLTIIMQFYGLYLGYLSDAEVGGLTKVVALMAGFMFVVDGPNVIQSIFGIDAGLSSVGQSLMGFAMGARAIGGIGKGIGGAAKAVGKTAAAPVKFGAKIAGVGKGIADGTAPNIPAGQDLSEFKQRTDQQSGASANPPTGTAGAAAGGSQKAGSSANSGNSTAGSGGSAAVGVPGGGKAAPGASGLPGGAAGTAAVGADGSISSSSNGDQGLPNIDSGQESGSDTSAIAGQPAAALPQSSNPLTTKQVAKNVGGLLANTKPAASLRRSFKVGEDVGHQLTQRPDPLKLQQKEDK